MSSDLGGELPGVETGQIEVGENQAMKLHLEMRTQAELVRSPHPEYTLTVRKPRDKAPFECVAGVGKCPTPLLLLVFRGSARMRQYRIVVPDENVTVLIPEVSDRKFISGSTGGEPVEAKGNIQVSPEMSSLQKSMKGEADVIALDMRTDSAIFHESDRGYDSPVFTIQGEPAMRTAKIAGPYIAQRLPTVRPMLEGGMYYNSGIGMMGNPLGLTHSVSLVDNTGAMVKTGSVGGDGETNKTIDTIALPKDRSPLICYTDVSRQKFYDNWHETLLVVISLLSVLFTYCIRQSYVWSRSRKERKLRPVA